MALSIIVRADMAVKGCLWAGLLRCYSPGAKALARHSLTWSWPGRGISLLVSPATSLS